jgi:hypothetical protein
MLTIKILANLFIVVGSLGVVYSLLLALAATVKKSARSNGVLQPTSNEISVLIPAHNEESCIGGLLDDLKAQEHPPSVVLVVADRCTDRTEAVATARGAEVLRLEGGGGGKSAALVRGLEYLAHRNWSTVLVLDADCRVGKTLLAPDRIASNEVVQAQVALCAPKSGRGLVYAWAEMRSSVARGGQKVLPRTERKDSCSCAQVFVSVTILHFG